MPGFLGRLVLRPPPTDKDCGSGESFLGISNGDAPLGVPAMLRGVPAPLRGGMLGTGGVPTYCARKAFRFGVPRGVPAWELGLGWRGLPISNGFEGGEVAMIDDTERDRRRRSKEGGQGWMSESRRLNVPSSGHVVRRTPNAHMHLNTFTARLCSLYSSSPFWYDDMRLTASEWCYGSDWDKCDTMPHTYC